MNDDVNERRNRNSNLSYILNELMPKFISNDRFVPFYGIHLNDVINDLLVRFFE